MASKAVGSKTFSGRDDDMPAPLELHHHRHKPEEGDIEQDMSSAPKSERTNTNTTKSIRALFGRRRKVADDQPNGETDKETEKGT